MGVAESRMPSRPSKTRRVFRHQRGYCSRRWCTRRTPSREGLRLTAPIPRRERASSDCSAVG